MSLRFLKATWSQRLPTWAASPGRVAAWPLSPRSTLPSVLWYRPGQALRLSRSSSGHSSSNSTHEGARPGPPRPAYGSIATRDAWLWIFPLVTFGLGCWQVYRLRWKRRLIETLEQRSKEPPVPLSALTDEVGRPFTLGAPGQPTYAEFTRVTITGEFLHDQEMYLGPRNRNDAAGVGGGIISNGAGIGYYVFTPFRLAGSGHTILVNRGWIPKAARAQRVPGRDDVTGPVTLVGMTRHGEPSNAFALTNKPQQNEWFWIEVEAMAAHTGALPVLVEMQRAGMALSSPGALMPASPAPRATEIKVRNTHLEYAITWFGLFAFSTWWITRRPRFHRLPGTARAAPLSSPPHPTAKMPSRAPPNTN